MLSPTSSTGSYTNTRKEQFALCVTVEHALKEYELFGIDKTIRYVGARHNGYDYIRAD